MVAQNQGYYYILENGTSIRPIRGQDFGGVPGIISRIPLLNCTGFYGQIKGHSGGGEGFMGGQWTMGEEEGRVGVGGVEERGKGDQE